MAYRLRIVPAAAADAAALIHALDDDLLARYPGEPVYGIDAPEFEAAGGVFVVGYLEAEAVACGALRPYAGDVEVKRMFVRADQRGRGRSRQLLAFLEDLARKRGFTRAVLQTGTGQPEAVALYETSGWTHIAPFGIYAADARSVCFEKIFTSRAT